MSEGRLRSGSVGNEGQPRSIIRWGSSSLRSSSLMETKGGGGGGGGDDQHASSVIKRNLHVPTLQRLSRDAFLYGLADGHATNLSAVAQGYANPMADGPGATSSTGSIMDVPIPIPIPIPASLQHDMEENGEDQPALNKQDGFDPALEYIPASTALLYDPTFWDGLLSEASRRRLLSDDFLTALCSSGIPPARLELRGGLSDVGVTDRFLVKAPRDATSAFSQAPQTFGSASEMIIATLQHLRLSGASGDRGSSDMAVERLVGANDLETFLHRLSRTAVDLESLTLGPGLLQHELSNTWIGSVKAISYSCKKLRSLRLHGLAFGGIGRSDSGSSIGGTSAPSSISALFEALARNCQSLEELSLARSIGIQDRHGQALLLELRDGTMSVSNLVDLDLSYTTVGPLTFSALCNRQLGYASDETSGRGIRKLNLDGTALDCSWLKRILVSLGQLEELSILSCPSLRSGPEVWEILAEAMPETDSDGPRLSLLGLELWFHSDDILQIQYQYPSLTANIEDDDREVALAAQYEMEGAIPFEGEDLSDGGFAYGQEEGWSCRHCTLINEDQAHRCAACNGRRYPHSANKCGKGTIGKDWSESDTSGNVYDGIPDTKKAPEYNFPSLARYPLKSFTAILHIEFDGDDGDDTGVIYEAGTALGSNVIRALPGGLTELKLSLYHDDESSLLQNGMVLGPDLASHIIERQGSSMQELELKSIRFDTSQALQDLCRGLGALRILKLFGIRHIGMNTAGVLREISTPSDRAVRSTSGCPSLEILQLCVTDGVSVFAESTAESSEDTRDVTFCSPYLKRLWIEGCNDIEKLELETPSIERLSVIDCGSLVHLGFVGFGGDAVELNPLQRLRLSGTNLSPYSIASLKLPNLQKLEVEGMALIEDWEFGSLVGSACQSLSELRLRQCRSLGAFNQWYRGTTSFQPLSVLELFRPSPAFDNHSFQSLFDEGLLRDVAVHDASGLRGYICAQPLATSLVPDGLQPSTATPEGERLAELLSKQASISRIGGGAIDEASSLASTEMLGGRGIERILVDFVESARSGGNAEYGFPPTLNSFQRKLVHDHAETLGLDHESIRLRSGVKVVKVRRRTNNNTDLFVNDDSDNGEAQGAVAAAVTPEQNPRNEINVESQTAPSNLERALLAAAASPNQVTFAPADTEGNAADDGGNNGDNDEEEADNDQVFEVEADEEQDQVGSQENDLPDEEEQAPATPPIRSRAQRRKARKAAKRGEVYVDIANNDDRVLSSESDGGDEDDIAFDPLLQQERYARFDAKVLRRLVALAHKLPSDSNGTAVCVRYLRGTCPYQHTKHGGRCRYAHFQVKASTVKKFTPLLDYVCGKPDDAVVGGRGSSRRKSQDRHQQQLSTSYGSNPESYGSDTGAQLMETHVGRGSGGRNRGGRRRRRKESIGSEDDNDNHSASEDGMSSRGSSPGRSWQDDSTMRLSSSPQAFDISGAAAFGNKAAPPLNLHRLLRLELSDCDGITGACLDGPCLVRLCLRHCSRLTTLDLRTPKLTTLDVSDCGKLRTFPLHDDSLRGLRVANLTGCRSLNESFCARLVNHCRALRQLHIFGSGASEKASNTRTRQRVKTKAGLAKLTAGRPKLTLISTKKEWRVLQAKREEVGVRSGGSENAGGVQEGYK